MRERPVWRRLFAAARVDVRADLDDELRFHLDSSAHDLVAGGVAPAEARQEAERRFGAIDPVRAACLTIDRRRQRRVGRSEIMSALAQDIRYALRTIRTSPLFSIVVALTLALGIGATSAVYSVVDAVLLRPLPYPEPNRLVAVSHEGSGDTPPASWPEFVAWRTHAGAVLTSVGAWWSTDLTLTGGGDPEVLNGDRMSVEMPGLLGVTPVLGRTFRPDEEPPSGERVIMVSDGLWRRRFGGDPRVLGRVIMGSGQPYTIIGVFPSGPHTRLPNELASSRPVDFWTPLRLDATKAPQGLHFMSVTGQLRPGLTMAAARQRMATIQADLKRSGLTDHGVRVDLLADRLVGNARALLGLLLGSVALVLLITCVNVANLLLARAAARQREMAIRVALGAARGRIVLQLLVESVLRAIIGGVAGAATGYLAVGAFHRFLAVSLPRFDEARIDGRVLAFTVVLSVLTGLVFGIVPAWRAARGDPNVTLRDGGRGVLGGRNRDRLRRTLVISEVALSFLLLVGAGLLLQSFDRLRAVPKGFDPGHVLSVYVVLPQTRYPDETRQMTFWRDLSARVATLPGVQGAAVTSNLPVEGGTSGDVMISGKTFARGSEPMVEKRIVGAGYFEALRARAAAGRLIDARDIAGAPAAVVVNESFVRRWLPGENPVGRLVDFAWETKGMQTIVGVVADMKEEALDRPVSPAMYIPVAQRASDAMYLLVRSTAEPTGLLAAVRRAVSGLDRDLPVPQVRTLDQVLDQGVASQRLSSWLIGLFAVMALVLSAVGLYGVISFTVTQRTQEMGIRVALGATRSDVLRLVLWQGVGYVVAGIAIGAAGSLAMRRAIASQLFGVGSGDPATYVAVAMLLGVVALTATLIPAVRASSVDPLVALRDE